MSLTETLPKNSGTNVQVAVRCRPMNAEERKNNAATVVTCDMENKSIKVATGPVGKKIMKSFVFDKVFGTYSRQEEVFDAIVRPIVDETLAGFNCTIFAYGQTGTGKTHTMEGDIHSPEDAGIVPRAVRSILEQLEGSGTEFTIRVSFLELYNEELQDLLAPNTTTKLKLCEDLKKGVVCQNLEEIAVLNVGDIFEIIQRGILQRQTAATLCNKNSSRSHTIFTLKIMIKEYNIEGEEVVRHGQLNLVDLAGSECIGRSGAKNERAREAGSINQSLLTLGRVITALVDHHPHVPYRDSKLTRLLQESLGGKAKTVIIATLSPSQGAVEETLSTLEYAYRARNIKNQPTVNQKLTKKVIMKEYFAEIETLRSQLLATREKNGVYMDPQDFYNMETKLASQESQLLECEAQLRTQMVTEKALRTENDGLVSEVQRVSRELEDKRIEVEELTDALGKVKEDFVEAVSQVTACQAIISEQTATERALHSQIALLNDEAALKQAAMGKLLEKVEVLETRLSATKNTSVGFLQEMGAVHVQLGQDVGEMQSMLTKGLQGMQCVVEGMRSTTEEVSARLTADILSVLQTMSSDSSDAQEKLKGILSGCQLQLTADRETAARHLATLSDTMTDMCAATASHVASMQAQMDMQSSELNQLQSQLQGQQAALVNYQAEHLATLRTDAQLIRKQLSSLQGNVCSANQQYASQSSAWQASVEGELAGKAEKLKDTVSCLLRDFLLTTSTSLASAAAASKTHLQEVDGLLGAGCAAIEGLANDEGFIRDATHFSAVTCTLGEEHLTANTAALQGMQGTVMAMQGRVAEHTETVGSKRKAFGSLIETMDGSQQSATKRMCAGLEDTSKGVNGLVEGVSTNSKLLQQTQSQGINAFMDKVAKCSGDLTNTMGSIDTSTAKQAEKAAGMLTGMSERSGAHHDALQELLTVSSTGSTPRKLIIPAQLPLVTTRPHEQIVSEVKQIGGYEDCKEVLMGLRNSSSAMLQAQLPAPAAPSAAVPVTAPAAPVSTPPACPQPKQLEEDMMDAAAGPTAAAMEEDRENAPPNVSVKTRRSKAATAGAGSIPTRSRSYNKMDVQV